MFTDWFYRAKSWLRQCFCHHEYEKAKPYMHKRIDGVEVPTLPFYCKCRKCGRMVPADKVPTELIVGDEDNES